MTYRTIQLGVLKAPSRKFTSCKSTRGVFLCAGWCGSLTPNKAGSRQAGSIPQSVACRDCCRPTAPALLFTFQQAETEGIPVGSRLDKKAAIQFKSGAMSDNLTTPKLRRPPVRFAQERRKESSSHSLQVARPASCCLTGWSSKSRK